MHLALAFWPSVSNLILNLNLNYQKELVKKSTYCPLLSGGVTGCQALVIGRQHILSFRGIQFAQ
jgi:hypothetical protein